MDLSGEDLSWEMVENFVREQERKLQVDRSVLNKTEELRKKNHCKPVSANEKEFITNYSPNQNEKQKEMSQKLSKSHSEDNKIKVQSANGLIQNSREKNKDELINLISGRNTKNSFSNDRGINKTRTPSIPQFTVDIREKEKDRLAEILSSSSSPYWRDKIPTISVSEHLESLTATKAKENSVLETTSPNMVKIGEYSPHNPNHPAGRPILGVGEHDEIRRLTDMQRKAEYNEYLTQARTVSRDTSPIHNINSNLRTVATQTEDVFNYSLEYTKSPRNVTQISFKKGNEQCVLSPSRLSPVTHCFDGLSEKELYRLELEKQVKEKNRLKEEMKRKEEEEEAKLEAKIQQDLEKMKIQYEEERLHRLELALRRRDQEEILRQRIAAEQLKALEESKDRKKQKLKNKSTSPNDTPRPKATRIRQSERRLSSSQSLPVNYASCALSNVHEVLRQPLLELQHHQLPEGSFNTVSTQSWPLVSNEKYSPNISPPIGKVKDVGILAQKTVFEPNVGRTTPHVNQNKSPIEILENFADKRKEAHRLLKEPLLPETFRYPVSPPMTHATIPPIQPSSQPSRSSPPLPASRRVQRSNCEILEDKWKVPYTTHNTHPPDIVTRHNHSVLTQLGAFRQHLEEEKLRMQQRVLDDST